MTGERLRWLERLAASVDWKNRQNAAMDPECPQETLRVLSGDEHLGGRFRVAANPNTPPETLRVLSGDAYWGVRNEVAKNPACPPELLDHLAQDEDGDVRTAAREQLKQREQRRRESACADYAVELDAGSMGYGGGL